MFLEVFSVNAEQVNAIVENLIVRFVVTDVSNAIRRLCEFVRVLWANTTAGEVLVYLKATVNILFLNGEVITSSIAQVPIISCGHSDN